MSYLIYKRTNRTTGKCYVGLTGAAEATRWNQHIQRAKYYNDNYKLDNAIRKYGAEDWDVEILETGLDHTEAKAKEVYYIGLNNSYIEGYNSTIGGDSSMLSRPVVAINIRTGEWLSYSSISAADEVYSHVGNVLSGAQRQSKGYTFVYAEDFNSDEIKDLIADFNDVKEAKGKPSVKRWTYEVSNGSEIIDCYNLEEVAALVDSSVATVHRKLKSGNIINGFTVEKVVR